MDSTKQVTSEDFQKAADRLGCEVATVRAVTAVESRGAGFDPEGFPRTLFEGHWFYKLTNGKFATTHPTLCYPKWTRQYYGKGWSQEKNRLNAAIALDREAALKSASWGLFQIMGFNHAQCGFDMVQEFVNAMCADEGAQLDAFVSYVITNKLTEHLKAKNWSEFARKYNGPGYRENKYDTKLQEAYTLYAK